jgi:hypothetical protein
MIRMINIIDKIKLEAIVFADITLLIALWMVLKYA